jgi:hypothetical protein
MTIERRAFVIVCDELLFSVTNKTYLNGIYATDIAIPGDELMLNQLVFYFTVETSKEKPLSTIILRVTPPGGKSTEQEINVEAIPSILNPSRPKMILRAPLLVQQILIRPGKIETIVIADGDELDAGGIWVTSVSKRP